MLPPFIRSPCYIQIKKSLEKSILFLSKGYPIWSFQNELLHILKLKYFLFEKRITTDHHTKDSMITIKTLSNHLFEVWWEFFAEKIYIYQNTKQCLCLLYNAVNPFFNLDRLWFNGSDIMTWFSLIWCLPEKWEPPWPINKGWNKTSRNMTADINIDNFRARALQQNALIST